MLNTALKNLTSKVLAFDGSSVLRLRGSEMENNFFWSKDLTGKRPNLALKISLSEVKWNTGRIQYTMTYVRK